MATQENFSLNTKAERSSETSGVNNLVTRPNKPEGLNPSHQRCASLKPSNHQYDQITVHDAFSTFRSAFKFMLAGIAQSV